MRERPYGVSVPALCGSGVSPRLKTEKPMNTKKLLALAFLSLTANFATADQSPLIALDKFWVEAIDYLYPEALVNTHFSPDQYIDLRKKAGQASNIYELTPIINEFLATLNVSHTRFYDDHSIDFYLFRSMFTTRDIALPVVNHIGAQFQLSDDRYVIREVIDGYPAAMARLRRGDVILRANDVPFHPYEAFNPSGEDVLLKVERNNEVKELEIDSVSENPNLSFHNAMLNSVKTISVDGNRIGYLRLWSGTHRSNLESIQQIVNDQLGASDAIILDLRGGFGGTWYEYLDPFFEDRSSYFSFSIVGRTETTKHDADAKVNEEHFAGPMVVLINEGTRSGKEGLAYQFKKSGRAVVIGATTEGAFTAGRGIFTEPRNPYFLYLATAEYLLDGSKIEGLGISPDVYVAYPLDQSMDTDPQLGEALRTAARLVSENFEGSL